MTDFGHTLDVLDFSTTRLPTQTLQFILALALTGASCRRVDAPASDDAGVDAQAAIPAGFVALELTNEPVEEVLQKLATAAGKPFVIDPDAQTVARCARISLLTGGNVQASKALDLVREALDSSGLSLVESPTGGMIVRRNLDKPLPASCQGSGPQDEQAPDSSASSAAANEFAKGVHKISETEYELKRASLEMLLGEPTNLAHAARVVPHRRDDKVVGLRLFGIRPSSPLRPMGLRNGDVLTHVEGQPITNPDEALKIYQNLKAAKKFELTIERRGEVTKMVYRLTDK